MKSAYLVLDMQNEIVHEDGAYAKGPIGAEVRARGVLANTRRAIEKARHSGIPIIFVRVGFSADYKECPRRSPMFGSAQEKRLFQLGSRGTEIHPSLGLDENDAVITKHRVSPFFSTGLEALLRAQGVEHIFASGVSTTAVVQAAVRDAHDRDYVCSVIEDGCAAASSDEHRQSIEILKRFATITNSEEVVFSAP
jgi:nicotinamidase-related amidase